MRSRIAILVALLMFARAFFGASRAHADDEREVPEEIDDDARRLENSEALSIDANDVDPALLGKPIERVDVVVRGTLTRTRLAPTPRIARGTTFSTAAVREAVRGLMEGGAYANVIPTVRASDTGVILTIYVVPILVVSKVTIEGGVLDASETIRKASLNVGDDISDASLSRARKDIKSFYRESGFVDASVELRAVELDTPGRALVSIVIDPKTPRTISRRVFVIDPAQDREVGSLKKEYDVVSGDRPDESELDDADRDLEEILQKKGFYRVTVRHRVVHSGALTDLYVEILEAARLEVLFDGSMSFDREQLLEAIGDRSSLASPVEVVVERLKKHYVSHGFYDAEVEATLEPLPSEGTDYLRVRIREGNRVRVDQRVFVCLPKSIDPDDVGGEIDSFLEEELPNDTKIGPPSPWVVDQSLGPTAFAARQTEPMSLSAASTFSPETYNRALKHLRDLYFSRGYLNAIIGPVEVVRARCSPRSRAGTCVEEAPPPKPAAVCALDASLVPEPEPPLPEGFTCIPDDKAGIRCSPNIKLRIAMHLGVQTILNDVVFEGNRNITEAALSEELSLAFGAPLSSLAVDSARTAIADAYLDLGFAYVEVRSSIETSPDRSRARVRFSIREGDPVTIVDYVVRGATRTDHDLITGRIAIERGERYDKSLIRRSEERIAQLGTFSSVSITLEDPDIPERRKRLIVTVAETPSQYIDPKVGFSTGEGLRFAFEYGHRNIGGLAIALTLRVELSYLFDFIILDEQYRKNLEPLPASQRLERRNSVRLAFPEIGLGPLFTFYVEGIDIRDNQRDFGLTRDALVPSLSYRPSREVVGTLAVSGELNDVQIFNATSVNEAILANPSLERLLRFPDGRTFALAQRVGVSWDRRDNPFSATSGTFTSADVEHVNAFPADDSADTAPIVSHFLRVSGRFAGYIRFTEKGVALALSISAGANIQLASDSKTYPDRLLFLGGFDTIRSFLSDSVVPEDVAEQILDPPSNLPRDQRLTIEKVAIRGGDLVVNPRAELRVPLTETFGIGLFFDVANVWVDPTAFNPIRLRYGIGAGVRIATPIGPLAFDYGINPERRPWEDIGALHFSIGLF